MPFKFKQRALAGKAEVFDPVRRKWLLMTPEEQVRQLFVLYLLNVKHVPLSHLSVEKAITVNGLTKRYDIVAYDRLLKPMIVIECKAPDIEITQCVLEQAGCYNRTLHAPIVGVTNGKTSHFFSIDFETGQICPIQDLPDFK